uniref:ferroxidase n=1 Tax=Panthera leo TaxID=9689 RepID=A0A8C8XLP7_PANLE
MWAMKPGHLFWALLFLQPLWPRLTDGATRVYYLGILDVQWNYAPKGRNVVMNQPLDNDTVASSFLKSDKNRIGSSYKKTIYKEYRDSSYVDEIAQPTWLGFLGPVLQAEVGDVILIHLKNFATRPYTIHPHGVFYEKDSEGSLYPDGSSGQLKVDDFVPPGGSHIYNWTIPEGHAPTDADPACLTWIYHSHVDAPRDIATGLIGPLITCKRGTLDGNSPPQRKDVDSYFFLLFSVVDENLSWHIDENIVTYCSDPASVDKEDEAFQESNRMHGSSNLGLVAKPFEKVTYRWTVPSHAGPAAQDPACLTWMYFSAADPIRDTNSGLVGPLLVCKAGALNADGKQKGVDKEFFLLFTVLDENKSWYSNANQATAMLDSRLLSEDVKGFQDSNRMHAINGFLFSNVPRLDMCKGDTVAWHLLGLGTETDVHGVMFQGNTVQLQGMRKSAAMLFPHTFVMAIMQPENPGIFEIYCQAGSHRESGMKAIYNVSQCPGHQPDYHHRYQAARIYYIMAEEVEWDYCPDRSWELEWHNQSEKDSYGHIFLSNQDGLLGSIYKKAVFREYTDGTFKIPRPRTGPEEHLGILGPLLRGEVGDILTVVFKNNASRPYSVHAHGVVESSTGWPLAADPGEVLTYQWNIPERSGPGPNDSACVSWIYYSAVDPIKNGESYRADVVDLFPGTFEVVEMVASNPGTWLMHCHVSDHVHAGMETLFTVLSQREHVSTITTITKEIGKASILRDIGEGNVRVLGMRIPVKNIEILASLLIAMSIILLLIALALGGVIWYQFQQRKLRRNRRSILDDSFKLLSLKQ